MVQTKKIRVLRIKKIKVLELSNKIRFFKKMNNKKFPLPEPGIFILVEVKWF